jgi:diguanylate cyclase (GGDEF)-like protein
LTCARNRTEAFGLVAFYTTAASALAGLASAVQASALGHPVMDDIVAGMLTTTAIAPLLTLPFAMTALRLHERERLLEDQANHDWMTGLLNRRGFFAQAAPLLERRRAAPLAAMLIDLDDFKRVNDLHGHAAGDAVVTAVAQTLASMVVPHGGVVGRLGGDEICVLIPGMEEAAAARLGQRLVGAISALPIIHDSRILRVSGSLGLAMRGDERDETLDALLARADVALYAAKARFHTPALAERLSA